MEKGYYKEIEEITGYKENDVEHKNDKGDLLHTDHIREPIIKISKLWVDYTQEELINNQIYELKGWYENYYTQHEQKLRRLHTLGKLTDEGKDPYQELINLYKEAEIKRAKIQELERLLSDNSK